MVKGLLAWLPLAAIGLVQDTPGGARPPQHGGYTGAPTSQGGAPGSYGGGQPTGYGGPPQGQPARSSGKAVAALVLGIVGFCLAWIPIIQWVSLITGILAVVLGFIAKKDVDGSGGAVTGTGMAVTGIILGILQLLILLLVVLVFAAFWAEVMRELEAEAVALLLR